MKKTKWLLGILIDLALAMVFLVMPETVKSEAQEQTLYLKIELAGEEYGDYTVSVNGVEKVTASSSTEPLSVRVGDRITVTFTPGETGRIDEFYLEDPLYHEYHHENDIQSNTYTFIMPSENRHIFTRFVVYNPVETISYIDENGEEKTVQATVLTGQENMELSTTPSNGYSRVILGQDEKDTWYYVPKDITYSYDSPAFKTDLHLNGHVHIIIADGKTLTVQKNIVYSQLSVYGQTNGTGRIMADAYNAYYLNVYGGQLQFGSIHNDGYVRIRRGALRVSGNVSTDELSISGGVTNINGTAEVHTSVTFGCTDENDSITIGDYPENYYASVSIADGQKLTDGTREYTGTLKAAERLVNLTYLNGKTLMLAHEHKAGEKHMTLHAAVPPTFDAGTNTYTDGNVEFYSCSKCGAALVYDDDRKEYVMVGNPEAIAPVGLVLPYFTFRSVTVAGYDLCDLVAYNAADSEVIIPNAVPDDYPVASQRGDTITDIDANAFKGKTMVTGVTAGDGVRNIGENAFEGCTNLQSVNFGSALNYIGSGAFRSCDELKDFISSSLNEFTYNKDDSFSPTAAITFHGPHGSNLLKISLESSQWTFSPTDPHVNPTWTWTDFSSATATFHCSDCQLADGATFTDEQLDFTDGEDERVFLASVTVDGREYTDTKTLIKAEGGISQTVTFKVVNGSWNEGEGDTATADKTVILTGYIGDTLKLTEEQIPAVGSRPNDTFKAGSWDVEPSSDTAFTAATTYTYTYAPKDATVVTKAPTARTLTYNGQPQELVTAGEAPGGTIQYASGKDGTTPPESGWSVNIPTGLNANVYYVWYKVIGDANHLDIDAGCVKAEIKKAIAAVTKAPTAVEDLTEDGKAHELVKAGTAEGGTMKYALKDNATTAPESGWSAEIPTGTKAGTYYVWFKAEGDANHLDSTAACVSVEIEKKEETGIPGLVTRCYRYILGREPDAEGKAFWIDKLESGEMTACGVMLGFFNSKEYKAKGDMTDEAFVEALYRTMLNRASDAEGKAYWLAKLGSGSTREEIIAGFCRSVEFGRISKQEGIKPDSGKEDPAEPVKPAADMRKIRGFVTRCYEFILGREPDVEGLYFWADKLGYGGLTAVKAIEAFMTGDEFLSRKLSTDDTVEALYHVMLNRTSDAEGKANWVSVLDAGNPIAVVINGIAGSPEFKGLCEEYGMVAGILEVAELPAEMIPEGEITENEAPAPEETPEQAPEQTPASEPAPADERTEKAKAFVTHCYQSTLLRDPGAEEEDYYTEKTLSGQMTAKDVARAFAFSQEFQGKWTDSTAFVRVLYRLCLDREADADGLVYWTEKLANGETAAVVFNALTENKEFVQVCATYGMPAGVDANAIRAQEEAAAAAEAEESAATAAPASEFTNEEKIRAFVSRFYREAMGREADEEGLNYYIGRILNGEATPKDVARDIILSEEFRGRMPGNEDLVRILYRVYLGREADEEGLANWAGQLDSGVTLETILNGFTGSEEFAAVVNGLK